jgi:hypothetical protein
LKAAAASRIKVVSLESAQFSEVLFSQLVESNGLDDIMAVVDTETDLSDMPSYFSGGLDKDSASGAFKISALISECYYYQLHAQPTWQCLSFLYQRLSMNALLADNVIIVPSRARVMAAAFMLEDLHVGHGQVGIVDGFNHSPLDYFKDGWASYSFPYKLGTYRKRLLSTPMCILSLDYEASEQLSISPVTTSCPLITDGICDCIAIWVDYDLLPGCSLSAWDGSDFPPWLKVFVRFLPERRLIDQSSSMRLEIQAGFEYGASDIDIAFDVIAS